MLVRFTTPENVERTVECTGYAFVMIEKGVHELHLFEKLSSEPSRFSLSNNHRAYAMNTMGQTIDAYNPMDADGSSTMGWSGPGSYTHEGVFSQPTSTAVRDLPEPKDVMKGPGFPGSVDSEEGDS